MFCIRVMEVVWHFKAIADVGATHKCKVKVFGRDLESNCISVGEDIEARPHLWKLHHFDVTKIILRAGLFHNP